MKTILEYTKSDSTVLFKTIQEKESFYSSGVLYMKILQQDLDLYNINSTDPVKGINAISLLNAGLTFFESDEMVYRATREYETIRQTQ